MAAFACFSNSNEKTTDSYRDFILRLQRETKLQLGDKPIVCAANFHYYSTYKNRIKEHVFKDFIYQLRMKTYDGTHILICENPAPTFKGFIRLIDRMKTPDDPVKSVSYYGEMKKIITGFMNYFTSLIDESQRNLDKYIYLIDSVRNQLLLDLIDESIAIYEENQAAFLEEYLPLNTEIEKGKYQEVIDAHANRLSELREIKTAWTTRQNKLEIFMKDTFEASMKKISELCNFTHTYISGMLEDRLFEISESITETSIRMNSNLRKCKEDCDTKMKMLIQTLYEKNKEYRDIYRREFKQSNDTAEISKTIALLKEKISRFKNEETVARLELETRFWNKKLKDFNDIASVLIRIRYVLDTLYKQLEEYNKVKCSDIPGTKTMCFAFMGEYIEEKILYFQKKKVEMSRPLITFFFVRGTDRTLYTNRSGASFYIDEFNHQNYIKHYGMQYLHVNCQGECVEHSENKPYYFDQNGRYTLNNKGEKLYQVAPCTSKYRIDEDDLFRKVTKDCGHSERFSPDCPLAEIKDKMADRVILPRSDPVSITGTLDGESVKYLWDNYGIILSEVLSTVAMKQPRNPVHAMGHLLLKRRFEASTAELNNFKKMGQKYRKNLQKERMDKAKAERRAWTAKQIKRIPGDDNEPRDPIASTQQTTELLYALSMGDY